MSDANGNKENPRIGGILVLGFLCEVGSNLPAAEQPKAAWQAEWEKTVKAAEQEGQVTLYSNEGIEASIKDFKTSSRRSRLCWSLDGRVN